MKNIFKTLFSRKKTDDSKYAPEIISYEISDEQEAERQAKYKERMLPYFKEQVDACIFIKNDKKETVLQDLTRQINLNKTGLNLTVNEKKLYGINTRLKISHALDVLNESGIKQENPKQILKKLHYQAYSNHRHDEEIAKYKKLGFKKYVFYVVIDERCCSWCKKQNGKEFDILTNINELIKNNCSCYGHCRSGTKINSAMIKEILNI